MVEQAKDHVPRAVGIGQGMYNHIVDLFFRQLTEVLAQTTRDS
jgi:hypothetical protein